MKKVISALISLVLIFSSLSVGAHSVTMYAPDGRTEYVDSSQVAAWESVGWYDYKPTVNMYALDGRTASVPVWDVEAWKNVGWYTSKPIDVYSLDGRKITIPEDQFSAYAQVGWYSEPVAKLYSKDGRTTIAPLKDVSKYRQVGWYPLHAFFFEANYWEVALHFPLQFEQYYAGTPDSGDLPRNIYSSTSASPVKINFADFSVKTNVCVWVEFELKEVFPYLNLYTDFYGRISRYDLENSLRYGSYSENYLGFENYTSPYGRTFEFYDYTQYPDYYLCEYDGSQFIVEKDSSGYINFNTAYCSFNKLV